MEKEQNVNFCSSSPMYLSYVCTLPYARLYVACTHRCYTEALSEHKGAKNDIILSSGSSRYGNSN